MKTFIIVDRLYLSFKMENIILESSKVVDTDKLAIFDFDWTLIRPTKGKRFPKDKDDWVWWRPSVPKVIKKYTKDGYRIVFVTEQSKEFKIEMIKNVIKQLKVPITAIIAMEKNMKKPNPELFNSVIKNYNKDISFYVGDAAGRDDDWADKDIKFAENINVKFYTPEEIFPMEYRKFSKIPIIPDKKEVIIMIGFPGSGKSTFINKQLPVDDYYIVDGDTLKTTDKMLKAANKHLDKSIVFDATNGTKEKRKVYIDFAKENNMDVRCIWISTPIEEALENIKIRYEKTGTKKIPLVALMTYQKKFEEPTSDEGCEVIIL